MPCTGPNLFLALAPVQGAHSCEFDTAMQSVMALSAADLHLGVEKLVYMYEYIYIRALRRKWKLLHHSSFLQG